ncbi:MAG: hypothetical protein AAF074_15290 [Pseudomonadota bacterium]
MTKPETDAPGGSGAGKGRAACAALDEALARLAAEEATARPEVSEALMARVLADAAAVAPSPLAGPAAGAPVAPAPAAPRGRIGGADRPSRTGRSAPRRALAGLVRPMGGRTGAALAASLACGILLGFGAGADPGASAMPVASALNEAFGGPLALADAGDGLFEGDAPF